MCENDLINKWISLENEYDKVCTKMLLYNRAELRERVLQLSEQMHLHMKEINKLSNNLEIIEKTRILITKQREQK